MSTTYINHDSQYIYFASDSVRIANDLGAEWSKPKRAWKIPLNHVTVQLFEDHRLADVKKALLGKNMLINHTKRKQDASGSEALRPYQRVDVEVLKYQKHKLIFNEQRTGKTATAITCMFEENLQTVLIVCPSGLKDNWKNEFEKWCPTYEVLISKGTPKKRQAIYEQFKAGERVVLVIGYETLRNDLKLLEALNVSVDGMLCDEAHRLRNRDTLQTKAVCKMGLRAKTRYALTGTPAVNHPSDVFGILQYAYPNTFTSYWNFVNRYFQINESYFGKEVGHLKREAEFTELLNYLSIQRKRSDVMQWIPKVTKTRIRFDMDDKQKRAYDKMLKSYSVETEDGGEVDAINQLAQLTRLRQIALYPKLLKIEADSPKYNYIVDYILDHPNEGIIIFSAFSSFLHGLGFTLRSKGIEVGLITGSENATTRQRFVDELQAGKRHVILANIIAGGVGFTMDNADTVIFADRDYVPANNEQAQDRIIPTTEAKARPKQIIDLVMRDTVEERILNLLEQKVNINQYVNNYGLTNLLKGESS